MFPFDLAAKREKIAELQAQTAKAGFWSDAVKARQVISLLNRLKEETESFLEAESIIAELEVMISLAAEEDDEDLWNEAGVTAKALQKKLEKLELSVLFSGRYDNHNAIVAIHPGAGGTESQDWASMLLRMYTRWAERKNYQLEILDLLPGEEAGIKSAALLIKGANAYGYLKSERGVHRLVRISPFDAAGRRHTSFASLDVLPEIAEDDQEIVINAGDIKVDTFRASGAGGQHVNKTDSAVRITHLPTGIVVTCQNERSQHANREQAMKILRARLADLYQQQQEAELNSLRGEQKDIAWGSQIRSYVFHPYSLVKDHRTGLEIGNIDAVMDGDLDALMESYLRRTAGKQE